MTEKTARPPIVVTVSSVVETHSAPLNGCWAGVERVVRLVAREQGSGQVISGFEPLTISFAADDLRSEAFKVGASFALIETPTQWSPHERERASQEAA